MLQALALELEKWSGLTYDELRSRLTSEVVYTGEARGTSYQAEILLLENTPDYVHVMVGVMGSDGRWAICPFSRSFLVYADGRVDK